MNNQKGICLIRLFEDIKYNNVSGLVHYSYHLLAGNGIKLIYINI
jgi:hypothetical protein